MQNIEGSLKNLHLKLDEKPSMALPALGAEQDFFYGTINENFSVWLDRFNGYAQAMAWNNDSKRQILPTFLRGSAEIIFNAIPIDDHKNMTFDQLAKLLKDRFSPALSVDIKSNETIIQYAVSSQQLMIEAYPELDVKMHDQMLLGFFIAGLQPEIWRFVINQQISTFVEAELAARKAEAQLRLIQQRPVYSILNSTIDNSFSCQQPSSKSNFASNSSIS